jgi:hypothetical protein
MDAEYSNANEGPYNSERRKIEVCRHVGQRIPTVPGIKKLESEAQRLNRVETDQSSTSTPYLWTFLKS